MEKLILLLLPIILQLISCEKVRYDNFKVYRITPKNEVQLETLKRIQTVENGYSFWKGVTRIGVPVDIMVPPHLNTDFKDILYQADMDNEVMIENVQIKIDGERSLLKSGKFDWSDYKTLNEIHDWLKEMSMQYPLNVKVVKGGSSYEGRDILGVHVSFNQLNENRSVFIEGGIHAREWISPATVTYILNEILTSTNDTVRKMAMSYDWYIFPNFNPDGYVYTFETNRLWRKTRKPYGPCHGADPNRNWGYMWNKGGSSNIPCAETYAGPFAFSEVETQSMAAYINNIKDKLVGYIGFHAYSQMLLIPFGDTTQHLENYKDLYTIGLKAAHSLAQRYGTKYKVGSIADVIYIASGSSMDWVKGTYHIPITYTYEGRDLGKHGFILPADQIIPSGEETLDSLITILSEFETKGFC